MADDKPLTPTELLINRMEEIDGVNQAIVIFRRNDGAINYASAGADNAELLGLLRFVMLSIEYELTNQWRDI